MGGGFLLTSDVLRGDHLFSFLLNWISDYRGDETESFFVGGGHGVVDGEMGVYLQNVMFFLQFVQSLSDGVEGYRRP